MHNPAWQKRRCSKRAVALLLVLIAVAVAATLALSFVSAQGTSIGVARNIQDHAQARQIAESGLELAVAHVRSNTTWRTDRPQGTWVADEPYAGGTFTIVGQDGQDTNGDGVISIPTEGDGDLTDDPDDPVTITVTGRMNGPSHVVHAVLTPAPAPSGAPQFAVSGSIEVKNDGVVDSFDSTAGAYGGANVSSNALIATNSTSNNQIKVRDDGTVNGSVQVGPGGDPGTVVQLSGNGTITGSTSALDSAVQIPTVSEPSGMGSSLGDVTITSGTTTWSSDMHFDKLEVKGSAIIEVSGNVTILVEDDLKFKDDAQLRLLSGASLTIYPKKAVKFEDQAIINVNTADPSALTINVLGSDRMEVKKTAAVYATVVAPNAELKVKENAHFYGAYYGKKVKVEGFGQLHADLSSTLGSGGGGGGSGYTYTVVWQERP